MRMAPHSRDVGTWARDLPSIQVGMVGLQKNLPWTLEGKCLATNMKWIVGDVEELNEVWVTLDICFDRREKYT